MKVKTCLKMKHDLILIPRKVTNIQDFHIFKPIKCKKKQIDIHKLNCWLLHKIYCILMSLITFITQFKPLKSRTLLTTLIVNDVIQPSYKLRTMEFT